MLGNRPASVVAGAFGGFESDFIRTPASTDLVSSIDLS
jgi:hypothetical protein